MLDFGAVPFLLTDVAWGQSKYAHSHGRAKPTTFLKLNLRVQADLILTVLAVTAYVRDSNFIEFAMTRVDTSQETAREFCIPARRKIRNAA